MSRSYSIEDVRVVYKAGQANIPLEDVLKVLEWVERKGVKTKRASVRSGKKTKAKRRGKGRLGDKIIKYLAAQGGKEGAHVKAIAAAVKAKVPNITAWFYTTGKKLIKAKSIKKTAPATFAFVNKG
jgi:phage gp16-like protein